MSALSFVNPVVIAAGDRRSRGNVPRILSRHSRQWTAIDQVTPQVTQLE
jgi:hypothetical protein